ncbi:MAG: hypothetical protein ACD_80C00131G0013 [uncultured bacterium (gcode 4)]|uniref:DNA (cytosine-5-)-methyltransferase n=1 Tax=uncultured bacterium (gcode 4) TaxID=1234023 RepID=K1X4G1_9BACT|nr:MAG: hypothetical protein ACD_80C00131G0013 [uncultured bacterium (gcode 4)]
MKKWTIRKIWVSLFSSAWVAETYLKDSWIDVVVANEIVKDRATLHQKIYKDTLMIQWDIMDKEVFSKILNKSWKDIDFLIAWPPCQWVSVAGKNRNLNEMLKDSRNYLIKRVIEFIKLKKPKYIMIENVPAYLKLKLPHKWNLATIIEILQDCFWKEYNVESRVLDSSEYGVPQKRTRAIIKLYKKWLLRWRPKKERKITVKDAIWHLPSLESWEKSSIPHHYARQHTKEHVLWMKHTPSWHSAIENLKYFPAKKDWTRISSYGSSYRRIKWDEPAPTITMRNDAISSQRNVHPWKLKKDWTYSDARVLTPLELMILSSLPKKWAIPVDTPESLIRKCLGECIPPLLVKKVVDCIWKA